MFDSLKAKLKSIFKKGSTLDEESVYKKEEPKQEPVVSPTTEKETEVPEQQTVEPPKEVKAEPARKE